MKKFRVAPLWWPYLLVAPVLVHLLTFRIGPSLYILVLSFTKRSIGMVQEFRLTFNNYRALISPFFGEVVFNSFYYVLGGLSILVVGSLLLALLLNSGTRRGKGFFRAVYFYPYTVVMVATGIIWAYGFRPEGFINQLIKLVGFSSTNWLGGDGNLAMPSLIITSSWRFLGYFAIVYLSGLQAIPVDYYDAAKVDGANAVQTFWHVTIPQLKPILLFVIVISSIELLRQFAIPKIMTDGGPFNRTNVLPLEIYNRAFKYFDMNQAAAESIVLITLAIVLSVFQFRIANRIKGA
jgi:ABC-type sugar transport system permease subunit